MVPLISQDARLIVWPGVGAMTANMNFVRMQPEERNTPHIHAQSEDTIFILEGCGSVEDLTNGRRLDFSRGQVVHIPAGIRHAVAADRGSPVMSVGGPSPADMAMVKAIDKVAT